MKAGAPGCFDKATGLGVRPEFLPALRLVIANTKRRIGVALAKGQVGTTAEYIPLIFHALGAHVRALFRIEVHRSQRRRFITWLFFSFLMVGGTGIEPVTPPV